MQVVTTRDFINKFKFKQHWFRLRFLYIFSSILYRWWILKTDTFYPSTCLLPLRYRVGLQRFPSCPGHSLMLISRSNPGHANNAKRHSIARSDTWRCSTSSMRFTIIIHSCLVLIINFCVSFPSLAPHFIILNFVPYSGTFTLWFDSVDRVDSRILQRVDMWMCKFFL